MPRRTATIKIDADGRDKGKTFLLTEMSSSQGERWAIRALLALGQSGADVPEDIGRAGLAGIAALGIKAFAGIPFHLAEPLLDDLLTCVQFVPDPARPQVIRPIWEDDIEEIVTRLRLREEVISLHVNFSIAAWLSKFRQAVSAKMADDTSTTQISPPPSEQ